MVKSEELETGNDSVVQTEPRPDPQPVEEVDVAMPQRTTAPAFQFYPKDFLSSSKVTRMSMTERGVYITLLSYCWLDGSLPASLPALAKIVGMKTGQFERIWTNSALGECFIERTGRFRNERLDDERRKQSEYRRRQSDNGKLGGRPKLESGGKAVAFSGLSDTKAKKSSSSPICNLQSASSKEKEISAEPPSDSTPVVMTFPVVGNPNQVEWALHQSRIDGLQTAYPNLDVAAECRKAAAWCAANPSRRKTGKGMAAFLVNWLNSASNRGGSKGSSPAASAGNYPKWYQDVQARKAAQS